MNTQLTPKSEFTATLKLTSDWHIGQGAGRPGNIDRLIQRDMDGLPMVPAKTLTGIWRDACETVAYGLDNSLSGPWSAWMKYLFGDQPALTRSDQPATQAPQAAALSIRAAYFSDDFKQAMVGKQALLEAATFIKPGIQIDPTTGCAKDDHLRFEEMARAGAILYAQVELELDGLDDTQQTAAYALLVAAAQWIERMGGKRRRGAGRCQLSLGEPVANWLSWIKHHPTPPLPLRSVAESGTVPGWNGAQTPLTTPSSETVKWVIVPLKITTCAPLVMACRTLGNIVETLDYIPGTHLLRLVVQCLKSSKVNVGRAIATQQLVVTNATLEINQQRGLPVPLALFSTKRNGGLAQGSQVHNRFIELAPDQEQLKGERRGYIVFDQASSDQTPDQGILHFDDVAMAIITHNTIEDARQQPTESVGGVYSYQAIQPNTVLRAEVRLAKSLADQLPTNWWQQLNGSARLGQSKKDGYGQVTIEALAAPDVAVNNVSTTDNQLTVWLQSNLLLRDQRLRPTASVAALTQTLSQQLGCELTLRSSSAQVDGPENSAKSTLSFMARSHRLESWQVRWGLPRPSLAGLAAGSCFIFEWPQGQTIDPNKLTTIAVHGLGERCAEGYGQVCFNPRLLTQKTSEIMVIKGKSSIVPEAQPLTAPHPDMAYARLIEKAAWRDAIDKAAQALCATPEQRKQYVGFLINSDGGKPSMSQLGSLRALLARLECPQQASVQTWLARIKEKRADRWPDGSLDTLLQFFNKKEYIWQVLSTGLDQVALPPFSKLLLVHGDDIWLKDQLWAEAMTSFMHRAMRAHKRALEGDSKTTGGTDHGTAA